MIKTGKELAAAALQVPQKFKTLYVLGCFGSPMTEANKLRFMKSQSYNRRCDRKEALSKVDSSTFGFDCVCLIKGLLWGWSGDAGDLNGGAHYASNGVPDLNANGMIDACAGVTTVFNNIQSGEVVWRQDHIGIYAGDGLVVECTPKWDDGVQITALANVAQKAGYNARSWTKHGRLPWIQYEDAPIEYYTRDDFVRDVQNVLNTRIDGAPGPVTLEKTPTVSRYENSSHMVVLPLQRRLSALGFYHSTLDGKAGKLFEAAVMAYQRSINGHADGIITAGNRTWQYLLRVS